MEWDNYISTEIKEWILSEIEKDVESSGVEFDDNYRVSEIGNPEQEELYKSILYKGCCGFHDFELIGPDGKRYIIGYNYGH